MVRAAVGSGEEGSGVEHVVVKNSTMTLARLSVACKCRDPIFSSWASEDFIMGMIKKKM